MVITVAFFCLSCQSTRPPNLLRRFVFSWMCFVCVVKKSKVFGKVHIITFRWRNPPKSSWQSSGSSYDPADTNSEQDKWHETPLFHTGRNLKVKIAVSGYVRMRQTQCYRNRFQNRQRIYNSYATTVYRVFLVVLSENWPLAIFYRFFGILMITPMVYSFGTSSPPHMTENNGPNVLTASKGSALNSSPLMSWWGYHAQVPSIL